MRCNHYSWAESLLVVYNWFLQSVVVGKPLLSLSLLCERLVRYCVAIPSSCVYVWQNKMAVPNRVERGIRRQKFVYSARDSGNYQTTWWYVKLLDDSDYDSNYVVFAKHGWWRSSDLTYNCCCRPDGIGTVLQAERVKFDEIKERLRILLENQITHFRWALTGKEKEVHCIDIAPFLFTLCKTNSEYCIGTEAH